MSSTPKRSKEQEQDLFEKLDSGDANDFYLEDNFTKLQEDNMFINNETLFKFLDSYHKACDMYGKGFVDKYLQRDIFMNY